MNNDIIEFKHNGVLLALVIPASYNKPGISFFTSGDMSQQLAYMEHNKGHIIAPHVHNLVKREVHYTKEVLLIRKGKMRVDFYDDSKNYVESYVVKDGDVLLLANGGHGFEILEDTEMFEVKQGPYIGDSDKTRFVGVRDDEVLLKNCAK